MVATYLFLGVWAFFVLVKLSASPVLADHLSAIGDLDEYLFLFFGGLFDWVHGMIVRFVRASRQEHPKSLEKQLLGLFQLLGVLVLGNQKYQIVIKDEHFSVKLFQENT